MHELPFVMGLLRETDEVARAQGLCSIERVTVRVGELSGIEPDCVSLYFETASEGHVAEGAVLEFVTDPALLRCQRCGRKFPHDIESARREARDAFCCPACGGDAVFVKGSGAGATLLTVEGSKEGIET